MTSKSPRCPECSHALAFVGSDTKESGRGELWQCINMDCLFYYRLSNRKWHLALIRVVHPPKGKKE